MTEKPEGTCAWPGCNVPGRMWAEGADGHGGKVVDVYLCEEHHLRVQRPEPVRYKRLV